MHPSNETNAAQKRCNCPDNSKYVPLISDTSSAQLGQLALTAMIACSPLASSSGNIFRDDDKENSRDYNNGRSQSRASQHSYNSSLSFNPNSQGGKGSRDSVQSPGGAHDRGHKEGERNDKSRDAAAQW